MTLFVLQVVWFFLIGVLFVGYTVLDGFDLGVGIWSFFLKKDEEKTALVNSIGPVWDGNEVWLITAGGALFAAFPHVYATVFSGFYLPLMLVLFALIFRAVSLEFRQKLAEARWRAIWGRAFAVGSAIPALLYGVALGNILRGVPLDASKNFAGTFFGLLNPYALLVGVAGFAMIVLHGALWISVKIEGAVARRAALWARTAWIAHMALFLLVSLATIIALPERLANFKATPLLWLIPILALAAIVACGILIFKRRMPAAFLAHAVSMAGLWGIVGAAIFPNMLPALGDPAKSLTIMNASSSKLTLTVMLIIALIGMPIVLAYTVWAYRAFRGKIKIGETSGYAS